MFHKSHLLPFQRTASNREGRGRHRGRPQQPRQGTVPVERRPQVAGDNLRPGQLQDGAVQKTSKVMQTRLCMPTVPQQQGQEKKSQKVQVQVKK